MSLGVTLTRSVGSPATYALPAESVSISLQKNPVQAEMAGGVNPVLFDLGQFKPTITIMGWIKSTASPSSDGTNPIPSKQNLEDFATSSYGATITFSMVDANSVTDTYECKVQAIKFEIISGRNDLWNYVLQLVTLGRT